MRGNSPNKGGKYGRQIANASAGEGEGGAKEAGRGRKELRAQGGGTRPPARRSRRPPRGGRAGEQIWPAMAAVDLRPARTGSLRLLPLWSCSAPPSAAASGAFSRRGAGPSRAEEKEQGREDQRTVMDGEVDFFACAIGY